VTITLFLAKALLCTPSACFPALVGDATPVGTFELNRRYVAARGYGGDVLQFDESARHIMAIHRVWLGKPSERRLERLASDDPADRRGVTNGCVNVMPDVYEQLVDAKLLVIEP
jgi:hypothetical protein